MSFRTQRLDYLHKISTMYPGAVTHDLNLGGVSATLIDMKSSSESGFTFVEIMIALGLFALLALMVSSMIFYAGKQQQRIQTRGTLFEWQQGIQYNLRSQPLPVPSST